MLCIEIELIFTFINYATTPSLPEIKDSYTLKNGIKFFTCATNPFKMETKTLRLGMTK